LARIAGIDIPRNKRVEVALTYIYGIGRKTSNDILKQANVNPDMRVKELTEDEVGKLRNIIENEYKVEGELRKEIRLNIKRLTDIRCFRGLRHKAGLPVRGQRTKTNARTRKGPAKAAVKSKKK
jgi:small subunit ribosomal protein S13